MNNIKHDLGNAGVYSNAAFQPSENPVFSTTQSDAQHARPSPNATRTPGQVSYLSPSQYPTSKHDSMNDLTMTMINEQSQQVAKLMEAQLAMKEAFEEKVSFGLWQEGRLRFIIYYRLLTKTLIKTMPI